MRNRRQKSTESTNLSLRMSHTRPEFHRKYQCLAALSPQDGSKSDVRKEGGGNVEKSQLFVLTLNKGEIKIPTFKGRLR